MRHYFKYLLSAFLVIIFLYLSCSYTSLPNSPYLAWTTRYLSNPIYYAAGTIKQILIDVQSPFVNFLSYFRYKDNLIKQLQSLNLVADKLKAAELEKIILQREISGYKQFFKIATPLRPAQIRCRVLTITKNSLHNLLLLETPYKKLHLNSVVSSNNNVVGRIINTAPLVTRVMLLSDSASSIPIKNMDGTFEGILSGHGTNYLTIEYVSSTSSQNIGDEAPFKVNDILLTSGVGGVFPHDLPVAKVTKVTSDKIFATPLADLDNLSFVTVDFQ